MSFKSFICTNCQSCSVSPDINSTYVYNPINAYNLVKRVMKYLPMVTNDTQIHKMFTNMSEEVTLKQIANGLYQIEEYSYSTPSDMINGIVQLSPLSKKHIANKKLELSDVISISEIARSFNNIDKEIAWLECGLKMANKNHEKVTIR